MLTRSRGLCRCVRVVIIISRLVSYIGVTLHCTNAASTLHVSVRSPSHAYYRQCNIPTLIMDWVNWWCGCWRWRNGLDLCVMSTRVRRRETSSYDGRIVRSRALSCVHARPQATVPAVCSRWTSALPTGRPPRYADLPFLISSLLHLLYSCLPVSSRNSPV